MGFSVLACLLIHFCVAAFVSCQLQTRPYSCVTADICRNPGAGSIIDPRILGTAVPGAVGPAGGTGAPGNILPGPGIPGPIIPGAPLPGTILPGAPLPGTILPGAALPGSIPSVGIVTPTICPAGYIQCTNLACGLPMFTPGIQDGFATPGAFPWQAFIRNNNNLAVRNGYAGAGVLLDQYHVLTAAHKVTNLTSISVLLGVYNVLNMTNVQTAQVAQVWIHMGYNQTYLKNDVAILRLSTPLNLGMNVRPICLPAIGRNYIGLPTPSCVVSGWGQSSFTLNDAPTQMLKQVHVPIVQNAQCTVSYSTIIGPQNAAAYLDFPNEICAGGLAQLDACTQDGGSPLVCQDTPTQYSLAGLVLWGKDCGQPGRYGVYLSVPAYISWIQCTIQCLQGTVACTNCPSRRFL